MQTAHPLLNGVLLNDIQSAITSTLIRYGHSSSVVISHDSGSTHQPTLEESRLLIEVSLSSQTLEATGMDQVFATPISEFLQMKCFSKSNTTSLRNCFSNAILSWGSKSDPTLLLVIGDLVDFTESEVYRWGNLGKKKLELIKSALKSIGLCLGMKPRIKGPKEIERREDILQRFLAKER